jgi:uncharacterized metal-binding protein
MIQTCTQITSRDIIMLPCSGASNVGQLSNNAAVELHREGYGKLYCLAGVAAGIEIFISETQKARILIAVDGCETGCTRFLLEKNGMVCTQHLIVTDLGIMKTADLTQDPLNLQLVKDAIQACCAEAKPIVRLGGCMCGI